MSRKIIQCPACKTQLQVEDSTSNPTVNCPKCQYSDRLLTYTPVEQIKIQCKHCQSILSISSVDEASSSLQCPKCKKDEKLINYSIVKQNASKSATLRNSQSDILTSLPANFSRSSKINSPGKLALHRGECNPSTIQLLAGMNLIGKKKGELTDVLQLDCQDPYMSRQHIQIDVVPNKNGFSHRLMDAGSKNGTKINGDELHVGDVVLLSPKDIITLGHTSFVFLPNEASNG